MSKVKGYFICYLRVLSDILTDFTKGSTLYLESACKTGCSSGCGNLLDFLYTA